MECNYCKNY